MHAPLLSRMIPLRVLACGLLALGSWTLGAPASAAQSVADASAVADARSLMVQQRYADAIRVLSEADSLSPDAAYLLGRAHQARIEHVEAVAAFQRADTTDADVLAAWGRSLQQLGRTPNARKRYAAAYAQAPDRRDVARPLAKLYADVQQWGAVRDIYARLVSNDPDNPVLLAQLAQAHQALGALGASVRTFENALEQNPSNLTVSLKLSRLYQLLMVPEKAKDIAWSAIRQHRESAVAWRRLGAVHMWQRAYGPAIIAFKSAVNYGDSSAVTLSNLGAAWYANGGPETARTWLRKSYAKDSTKAVTAFYLGLAHKDLGAPDSALVYLRRAANGYGRTTLADIYEHMGDAHHQRDDARKAIQANRLSLGLNPDQPEVQFHLATVYDAYYRDAQPAVRAYTRFLDMTGAKADSSRRAYAEQRLQTLREDRFFRGPDTTVATDSLATPGAKALPSSRASDSETAPADSARRRE